MGTPGYDCIVYHKGECVYRHFNGYNDAKNKIPMNGKEVYNIYSCSKPITCAAALLLYEQGKFNLEDKLSKYMPEFEKMYVQTEDGIVEAKRDIAIIDLFCMTAGFSYNVNSPMLELCKKETEGRCPTREAMKYLAKEPLLFEPGSGWKYSLCHDVLAALVEVVSGMRFGEFVKKNIFEPLGMNDSTFLLDDKDIDKVACQYKYNKETKETEEQAKTISYKLGTEYESGGAGCISTVDDYIKFLEAIRKDGIILQKETLDLMTTNLLTPQLLEQYVVDGYGYGLGVRCSKGDDDITEFGWGGAAGGYLAVDREKEITIFYVQHVRTSPVQDVKADILPIIYEALK